METLNLNHVEGEWEKISKTLIFFIDLRLEYFQKKIIEFFKTWINGMFMLSYIYVSEYYFKNVYKIVPIIENERNIRIFDLVIFTSSNKGGKSTSFLWKIRIITWGDLKREITLWKIYKTDLELKYIYSKKQCLWELKGNWRKIYRQGKFQY